MAPACAAAALKLSSRYPPTPPGLQVKFNANQHRLWYLTAKQVLFIGGGGGGGAMWHSLNGFSPVTKQLVLHQHDGSVHTGFETGCQLLLQQGCDIKQRLGGQGFTAVGLPS